MSQDAVDPFHYAVARFIEPVSDLGDDLLTPVNVRVDARFHYFVRQTFVKESQATCRLEHQEYGARFKTKPANDESLQLVQKPSDNRLEMQDGIWEFRLLKSLQYSVHMLAKIGLLLPQRVLEVLYHTFFLVVLLTDACEERHAFFHKRSQCGDVVGNEPEYPGKDGTRRGKGTDILHGNLNPLVK